MKKSRNHSYLNPESLLQAYSQGFFPMASSRFGAIEWHSPDPRGIIPLDNFIVSRSLRRRIEKGEYETRVNTKFEAVMRACAEREETWISEEIISAYTILHWLGYAHSVETWFQGELVGGLYGVALRGAFFGESMFSRRTDASKVALAHLVNRLKSRGFTLLDTQFVTEHLQSLGAVEISRSAYLELLAAALELDLRFDD